MLPPEPSPAASQSPPLPPPFPSDSSSSPVLFANPTNSPGESPRYTAATEALDALVAGKGGKKSSQKALLLMLSLGAFVLWLTWRDDGGISGSAFVDGAFIIGILFIHELGHFLSMKIFGYKDLSMFFIPFFGAAVTGRKHQVQSWQDAIVTLAGPLPGILIGVPMYFYGRLTETELLEQAGFLMVIINAINLLPIKPLDGGRFFDTILFSRWRWLALLFSAFSTVGFALFLIYASGWSPLVVGLFTLFQITVSWKRWKVLRALERQAPQAVLAPDGSWPVNLAGSMFETIDAVSLPQQLKPAHLAAFALQHLRRKTTPPRLGPTVALLMLYLFPLIYIAGSFYYWMMLKSE